MASSRPFELIYIFPPQAVLSAIKMREARTAATMAPAITGAVRVGSVDSSAHADSVQFVFVGATTSKAVAAARMRYATNCTVTRPAGGGRISTGSGINDQEVPVVNPLLQHNFLAVDGNGDKLQVGPLTCKLCINTPPCDLNAFPLAFNSNSPRTGASLCIGRFPHHRVLQVTHGV